MAKAQNIYNYKPPKSGNDEASYFLTRGRIRRRAFFLRLGLVFILLTVSNLIMELYAKPLFDYWKETGGGVVRNNAFLFTYNIFKKFNDIVLPALSAVFMLIQCAKRIHDVNRTAWLALAPFHNIMLLLLPGTHGQNDYGVDPRPQKVVKYFDELEKNK